MSLTTRWRPCNEPAASLAGDITVIEHAEPGGVICTTRKSPSPRWSTSRWKPTRST